MHKMKFKLSCVLISEYRGVTRKGNFVGFERDTLQLREMEF